MFDYFMELALKGLKHSKFCKLVLWWALFVPSTYFFSKKIPEKLCVMTLKSDAKLIRKLTRSLKNDISNLVKFHASNRKSENLHFDGFLLSKAYKVLDEKVQKSYLS